MKHIIHRMFHHKVSIILNLRTDHKGSFPHVCVMPDIDPISLIYHPTSAIRY